jgi:hypothetical protein
MTEASALPEVDPVTFEVIKHRLWQINDEQSISCPPCATLLAVREVRRNR